MVDVVHVKRQTVMPGKGVSPIHCSIPGYSRLYRQLPRFLPFIQLGFALQVWTGAYYAHIALQDVQELGQFINACLAHDPSHARHAGVVGSVVSRPILHNQIRRIYLHGPQLVHDELFTAHADALGVVEHGPAIFGLDGQAARSRNRSYEW